MPWFAIRPTDPADPRWPLPGRDRIVLKAEDPAEARTKFEEAYPSEPYGSPTVPVPDATLGSFRGDQDGLSIEPTDEPPAPKE